MRFALIDNKQTQAESGLRGICPGCFQPVIAKCGEERIHHWAHLKNKNCDSWWEPETAWHRSWKNNFPIEWQEAFLNDETTGEKHIADVRTNNGLVVEFQHSHIDSKERSSRESFYKNMIWVVDGMRLKRDFKRFVHGTKNFHPIKKSVFYVNNPEKCFASSWLKSSVPVIFDYRSDESVDALQRIDDHMYCLFPIPIGGIRVVAEITRSSFINSATNGKWSVQVNSFMNLLNEYQKEGEAKIEATRQRLLNRPVENFSGSRE